MPTSALRRGMLAGALLVLAGSAHAQTITLDEGTFRILVDGTEVGMETFSIRQNGSGSDAVVIARGRVVLDAGRGGQEVQASVQFTGGALRPAAYDMEVRGGDAQRINARVAGSRVSARISAATGENMREYLVSEGAVLVDEGVAHHYYFVARRSPGSAFTVPIMVPRSSRQVSAQVAIEGAEAVRIGTASVQATRFTVSPAGGAAATVWADEQGRILKVEIPARKYVAIRTAAP